MAVFEGAAGLGRAFPDWLARQTTVGVASNPHQTELPGRGVCVLGEEIGPRMLARLAKQTGLSPEDLR